MRPVENRIVVGSNKKNVAELGCKIQYSIEDIYKYWESVFDA